MRELELIGVLSVTRWFGQHLRVMIARWKLFGFWVDRVLL